MDFEQISNFRDALKAKHSLYGTVKDSILFRSASLDLATASDVNKITKGLNIRTIIDLRRRGEGFASTLIARHYQEAADSDAITNMECRVVYRIDLIKTAKNFIWKTKVLIKRSALEREGLLGLNKVLLEGAATDIKHIMDICAESSSYPIVVHCSAGKDRTGLIICLLQILAGIDDDEIVSDYSASASLLGSRMGSILVEIGRMGLDERFAKSPPDVMQNTIKHIKSTFGSIENYLESIGVNAEKQSQIRKNLLLKSNL